jgi:excisionase family DNA binding protein
MKKIDFKAVRMARENLSRIAREHPELTDQETRKEELEQQWLSTLGEIMRDKTVFTIEETASIFAVHKDTVRRAIKAGKLKAAKLGKEYRISRLDLEAYYRAHGGGELFQFHEHETERKE